MRYPVTTLLASLLLVGSSPLVGCEEKAPTTKTNSPATQPAEGAGATSLPDRDPQLAKKLVADGALLLDVRSQEEWDERHLEGANLIPVNELGGRLAEVAKLTGDDKTKPIVVYCRSGARAGRAKKQLLKAGYTQVTNLGGIDDWPSK